MEMMQPIFLKIMNIIPSCYWNATLHVLAF